jgi:hypothetical protein
MESRLEVGDALREAFETYRDQAGVLLPVAFWLFLATSTADELSSRTITVFPLALLLGIVGVTLYQGMVICLVRDLDDGGTEVSVGALIRSALPVVAPLIGAWFLAWAGILIGFVLLLIPGLYLLTQWAVVAPVIVVERQGVIEAFGRSRELVRGKAWPVFWATISALLLGIVAYFAVTMIATAIIDGPIVRVVFDALAASLTAPIEGLVAAVLYFRLLPLASTPPPASEPAATPPLA